MIKQKPNLRKIGFFLVVFVVPATAALIIYLGIAARRTTTSGTTSVHLRIGYRSIASNIAFFVAIEKGFFKERGLNVEPIRFETADAGMDALLRGDIMADFADPLLVFLSRETALPGKLLIFGFQLDSPGHTHEAMIVPAQSNIRSLGELRKKVIGTYPGVGAKTYLTACLLKAGFDQSDIVLKPLQASLQLQSLRAKQVDALFSYEPTIAIALNQGIGRILESALFPRYLTNPTPITVFPMTRVFVNSMPNEAKAVASAVNDAISFISRNPREANRLMIKYVELDAPPTAEVVGQLLNVMASDIDLKNLQLFVDWHEQKGLISSKIIVKDVIYAPPLR